MKKLIFLGVVAIYLMATAPVMAADGFSDTTGISGGVVIEEAPAAPVETPVEAPVETPAETPAAPVEETPAAPAETPVGPTTPVVETPAAPAVEVSAAAPVAPVVEAPAAPAVEVSAAAPVAPVVEAPAAPAVEVSAAAPVAPVVVTSAEIAEDDIEGFVSVYRGYAPYASTIHSVEAEEANEEGSSFPWWVIPAGIGGLFFLLLLALLKKYSVEIFNADSEEWEKEKNFFGIRKAAQAVSDSEEAIVRIRALRRDDEECEKDVVYSRNIENSFEEAPGATKRELEVLYSELGYVADMAA